MNKLKADLIDIVHDDSVNVLLKFPFYGSILASLNKNKSDSKQKEPSQIHALGTTTVVIKFEEEMWRSMASEQRSDRLIHELLHYIYMHPWADKPRNKGFFYTACDLAVNKHCNDKYSIRLKFFEDMAGKYKLATKNLDGWRDFYKFLNELSGAISKNSSDEDKIKYSQQAMAGDIWAKPNEILKESVFFFPKTTKGDLNLSQISQMQEKDPDKFAEMIQDMLDNYDDPWQAVEEGTSGLGVEDNIKRALTDAKSRGPVPGGLSEYVNLLLSPPKVNWKRVLRTFTSTAGSVESSTTMSRRSKRFKTFPSIKIRRTQKLAVIVDTSGSVSDEEFQMFISEMNGMLYEKCEIVFIQADAVVDKVDIYKNKLPNDVRIERLGNGGTEFGPALKFVKEGGKNQTDKKFPSFGNVDGTIYLTDGYAPAPQPSDYPMNKVMWLSTGKKESQLEQEGFQGVKAFLDRESKDEDW